MLERVMNKPMLLLDDNYLVIADLHLGVEEEFYKKGITILNQVKRIYESIKRVYDTYKFSTLYVIGDVKHNIPTAGYYEEKNVYELFQKLSEFIEVHIVPGNHDGGIEKLVPKNVIMHDSSGILVEGKYGLFHGHRWPSLDLFKSKFLICGHRHAILRIKDELGVYNVQKIWLEFDVSVEKLVGEYVAKKGKSAIGYEFRSSLCDKKLLLIPAFSDIVTGSEINKDKLRTLGPIMSSKIVNRSKGNVYLLDNTYLGAIEEIIM